MRLSLLLLTGCAARFADRPIVWEVDDDLPIEVPDEREYIAAPYFADAFVTRAVPHALGLPSHHRARDVNALGEVPDSTWFTNRIGVREVSPDEAATASSASGPPELPLTIVSGKSGGGNPGFVATDVTDRTFLIKFDTPENPEQQTGASVVVNRVLWTAGYNVPADTLFTFGPGDIVIDPEATYDDAFDREFPFTQDELDAMMTHVPVAEDGRWRASASEYLSGMPVGGWPLVGTRSDDPNDNVPHQHRRSLRGLRAIAAWVSHTDMKEDNTLDVYVGEEGEGHLRHYLLDFGEALGAHQSEKDRKQDGYEYLFDWEKNGLSLAGFGIPEHEWERQELTPWPSMGWFGAEHFTPEQWREAYPYRPFSKADRADLYWGAKQVMAFNRAHVEAIVAEGQYSDPAVSEYLVDVLMARRQKIGEAWIDGVSALDDFTVEGQELCMSDLAAEWGVAETGTVLMDGDSYIPGVGGRYCVPIPQEDYAILTLRVRRSDGRRPAVRVHVRGTGEPRVLGVVRTGR